MPALRTKKKKTKDKKSAAIEARQAAYRGLILDAAERVFATKGFDGAKIKDVADAAGLAGPDDVLQALSGE